MQSKLVFFCLLAITIAANLPAQEQMHSLSLKQRVARGLERSDVETFLETSRDLPKHPERATDVGSAIVAAGKSGDSYWIPYLTPFIKYGKHKNRNLSDLVPATQLALARLGAKDQLLEIACEMNYGTPLIQYDAVTKKLKSLGGWFSIRLMAEALKSDSDHRPLMKVLPSDEIFGPPRFEALFVLPQIVPNPPPYPNPAPYEASPEVKELSHKWLEWIHENQDSLQKLSPVGQGVEASEKVCKSVLKNDMGFDRSLN